MCAGCFTVPRGILAIAYFNRLVELDPGNKLSFYNRGMFI